MVAWLPGGAELRMAAVCYWGMCCVQVWVCGAVLGGSACKELQIALYCNGVVKVGLGGRFAVLIGPGEVHAESCKSHCDGGVKVA